MSTCLLPDRSRLDDARRLLLDGRALPAGLLPDAVARSWERSRDAGLDPWQPRLTRDAPPVLALAQADQRLAAAIAPELDRLWQVLGGPTWTLFCVNPTGVIVQARHAQKPGALAALQAGRRIQERDIGTTAPSCVLMDGQPAVVRGAQHFLREFDDFFCVSVPVYGLHGELSGALDLTGLGDRNASSTLEQLRLSALAAENSLYANLPDWRVACLHPDPRLLGTPLEGLLAFDERGRIRAANSIARRLLPLGLLDRQRGCPWESLFAMAPEAVLADGKTSVVRLHDGTAMHMRLRPQSRPATRSWPVCSSSPLGRDRALNARLDQACRAFRAGLPILLTGETGTGKEVFARTLHEQCLPSGPFVAVNCSAIPESLIEAELFGYVEGTFTGARKGGARGRIEEADGGTLLLDEIGDMPAPLQTRLLRVLQERRVTPLGSSTSRPVDLRIVSATHCRLEEQLAEGRFREDLYYRINGYRIELPALREREDLDCLVETLLQRHGGGRLHPEAMALLRAQPWPGNIRQLEQSIRLAVVLAEDEAEIRPCHFPQLQPEAGQPHPGKLKAAEQDAISAVLERCHGNMTRAAAELGISRTTLYKKLAEMGKR